MNRPGERIRAGGRGPRQCGVGDVRGAVAACGVDHRVASYAATTALASGNPLLLDQAKAQSAVK